MTRRLLDPFLLLLARLTAPELARAVQFLKVENAMPRSRLPRRIDLSPRERDRLLALGESLGVAVRELVPVVTYRTFLRWKVAGRGKTRTRAPNPHPNRTPEQIRELVIRLASETGWGYTRILGTVPGERHPEYLPESYVSYCNSRRPHRGLGNGPVGLGTPPPPEETRTKEGVACDMWLGGLLEHHRRAA